MSTVLVVDEKDITDVVKLATRLLFDYSDESDALEWIEREGYILENKPREYELIKAINRMADGAKFYDSSINI